MPPDEGVRHQREFGCPVNFSAPIHTSFVFDRTALDIPLTGASRELAEYNDRMILRYLAQLDLNDTQARLRALLPQQLPSGAMTKACIGKQWCLSSRTLQVRLSKCNTTFYPNKTLCARARVPRKFRDVDQRDRLRARVLRYEQLQPRIPALDRVLANCICGTIAPAGRGSDQPSMQHMPLNVSGFANHYRSSRGHARVL
jgi:hypothetical protein